MDAALPLPLSQFNYFFGGPPKSGLFARKKRAFWSNKRFLADEKEVSFKAYIMAINGHTKGHNSSMDSS
jgi:hypothetical protein